MFDSALDLITEAASNSLFIFCFCNLIIVMILLGSKSSSSFQQESASPTPVMITNAYEYSKQEIKSKYSFPRMMDVEEQPISQEQEAPTDDNEEDRKENCSSEEVDDELRKRVEEFIEKVNRGWRAELLRTSRLVNA